ncbi:hypothetical protein Tco_0615326 [Tanacetum coccineum]
MHEDFEYVESLEKEIDKLESEKADFSNIYDLLLEECVSKDVICSYLHSLSDLNAHTGLQCLYLHKLKECELNHSTGVSRPPLKSYQVKDNVMPNNSQVKFAKKEVEDHHRISSISKKTKSVTAYNDSSNSRTSNVNVVCAECGKCMFNSNHDACVSKYLNDVNARTKKPKVVPISASKPKRKMNKSVATPHKKTVASDTTIQKPKSYFKELYENTNKAWKWWIEKKCPSEYKWTQMTPSRPSLKWKPTGRIFSNVHVRWDYHRYYSKLLHGARLIVNPHMGQIVDNPSYYECKQAMGLSAGTSSMVKMLQRIDLNADALYYASRKSQEQNVVPTAEKIDSSQQGLEFLFSPLLEEYYNPAHGHAEDNNNDQAPNASFQEYEFINPFCTRAKYGLEILKKHNMDNCYSIGTPLTTKPKLDEDLSGEPVDQSNYRSKIRSLMYLTSSRPDLGQAVCYCVRYQARPTQKHLKEVKRIFKCLKGTINMGLWYPKDFGFNLTAFSDADHAGCIDTCKSTSGGIQFLGDKLIS